MFRFTIRDVLWLTVVVALAVVQGAPTNPDGTLNLVRYVAWLVKECSCGD